MSDEQRIEDEQEPEVEGHGAPLGTPLGDVQGTPLAHEDDEPDFEAHGNPMGTPMGTPQGTPQGDVQ